MTHQIGAIAAGHEQTARAGARMLAEGGNAIDAATAAVFASCTCEPTLTGLGGAGFATVRLADGAATVLDFFAAVPGHGRTIDTATGPVPVEVLFGTTAQTFHVGPQSCAVPGFVAGVLTMHERFGRLPRAEVLAPGIELARTGLGLTPQQAYCHHILEKIVTRRERGRTIFAPRGTMLAAGDHFRQSHLAGTLELLAADGADAFYRGDLAREIVRWADEEGGLVTLEDLDRYAVRIHEPVRTTYRDLTFLSVPPPSSGGALVGYALRLIDVARGNVSGIDVDSGDGAELLVAAMIAANAVRGATFDRYLYGGGLVEWLLDDASIERGVHELALARGAEPWPSSRLGSTTHLSVIDADGNAVAMTTSTGCGSGEFVGDTGIHLNNMLGEEDLLPVEHTLSCGDRLTSMMAPSLLVAGGRPLLATGSAGSNRLRSAILQTLVRIVESRYGSDAHRPLQERLAHATATGRLHAEAGLVHAEPDVPASALERLELRGHQIERWPMQNLYFGGVNMVAVNDDGTFAAAADPRRGGGACIAFDDGSLRAP